MGDSESMGSCIELDGAVQGASNCMRSEFDEQHGGVLLATKRWVAPRQHLLGCTKLLLASVVEVRCCQALSSLGNYHSPDRQPSGCMGVPVCSCVLLPCLHAASSFGNYHSPTCQLSGCIARSCLSCVLLLQSLGASAMLCSRMSWDMYLHR